MKKPKAGETFGVPARIEYPDFEIVAIDDGSADRTAEILDSLTRRIPNLRVVHLAKNRGKSTALNIFGIPPEMIPAPLRLRLPAFTS